MLPFDVGCEGSNLAWVLLKHHVSENTTATAGEPQSNSPRYRFGHRSPNIRNDSSAASTHQHTHMSNEEWDTITEAKDLIYAAHEEGHQQADLAARILVLDAIRDTAEKLRLRADHSGIDLAYLNGA